MREENKEQLTPKTKDLSITWHAMSSTDVLEQLNTGTEIGLTAEEVKARQEKYGLNELKEAPKTTFLAGQPQEELVKYAVVNKIDLIVLGVRGHSLMEKLFVGSTTDLVARQAPCPVLSVRPTVPSH